MDNHSMGYIWPVPCLAWTQRLFLPGISNSISLYGQPRKCQFVLSIPRLRKRLAYCLYGFGNYCSVGASYITVQPEKAKIGSQIYWLCSCLSAIIGMLFTLCVGTLSSRCLWAILEETAMGIMHLLCSVMVNIVWVKQLQSPPFYGLLIWGFLLVGAGWFGFEGVDASGCHSLLTLCFVFSALT